MRIIHHPVAQETPVWPPLPSTNPYQTSNQWAHLSQDTLFFRFFFFLMVTDVYKWCQIYIEHFRNGQTSEIGNSSLISFFSFKLTLSALFEKLCVANQLPWRYISPRGRAMHGSNSVLSWWGHETWVKLMACTALVDSCALRRCVTSAPSSGNWGTMTPVVRKTFVRGISGIIEI